MKTLKLLPLLVWFAAVLAGLAPRSARADVSFQFFYDSLEPYGQWLQVGDYGYCWRPNDVDADWSPYSDGYWAYTDAGWTWVSYEDWGGITYHYGRWVDVRDEGWCWVPDYDWGPAWVSWRNSDDYIGWAPLPPEARWDPGVGFGVWVDNTCDIGPGYYNFCHSYDFGAGFLRPCLIPRVQNIAIIQKTVNITNISINNVNRGVFNGGPNFRLANQRSRRPIPALKLVQRNDIEKVGIVKEPGRPGGRARAPLLRTAQRGNQLEVFAPTVTKAEDPATLKPGKIGKAIEKEKVNKGWAVVKDPEERKQLKQQMQQQTANLTPATAPAKQAQISDLDMVPQKADPNAASPAATARAKGKGKLDNQPGGDALGATEALKGAPRDEGKNGKITDNAALPGQGRLGKNPSKTDELATPDQQTDRQAAKARQAERAMEQQRENALADQERAARQARRRDVEAQQKAESQRGAVASEAARSDEVDRAVARARRQQELNAQENVLRENQRAATQARREEQAAQAGAGQQQQIESQRQQAVRERQLDMQRQMQIERGQQIQQQRALENQRAAQQQRQAEAQRQIQIQRQQPPPQAQPQGGGGGGHGGKQQAKDDEQKKQR